MKKIILLVLATALLASCGVENEETMMETETPIVVEEETMVEETEVPAGEEVEIPAVVEEEVMVEETEAPTFEEEAGLPIGAPAMDEVK